MHFITLSFDDGFLKSNLKIAELYEKHKLSASFNIVAKRSLTPQNSPKNLAREQPLGDFDQWNELAKRGHEIMPHGYDHSNKAKLPFEESQELILKCLDVFKDEIENFDPLKSVFNFPFNCSTPQLEDWLDKHVGAYRTGGGAQNPLPANGTKKITTSGYGPENCEDNLDQEIATLLSKESGWLVYTLHGLDEEGWGPIRSIYLEQLLERLIKIKTVKILPVKDALNW